MSSEAPATPSLPELKDADLARILMGTASEVCQAIGVTVKFDLQVADASARSPEALIKAIKRLTMTLTHVVARENLSAEYIASMYQKPLKKEETAE